MSITPKAIQDLLDELEASKQSRLRAWNVLQRPRLVLSEAGNIAIPPPAPRRRSMPRELVDLRLTRSAIHFGAVDNPPQRSRKHASDEHIYPIGYSWPEGDLDASKANRRSVDGKPSSTCLSKMRDSWLGTAGPSHEDKTKIKLLSKIIK